MKVAVIGSRGLHVTNFEKYLPEYVPDFSKCSRVEIYDANEEIFR